VRLVRITECFQCGAKEIEIKLIDSHDGGPVLCENCYKKNKTKG